MIRWIAVCGALTAAGPAVASDTLIKGGTVLTVTKGTLKKGDVLVHDGKIAAIGPNLKAPAGAKVIEATGKFVMPGIIDAHSHMAMEGGLNEGTEVVSAECDVMEIINDKDPGIKWALAGGVTAINAMHGSANPIGGLTATLKLRWGKTAEEMKMAGARRHIKFALGENPKRVHADRGVTTRLGVAETLRQQFTAAREYQRDWDEYKRRVAAGEKAVAPHKDLKLESLAAVLRGDIWIQCHCYRADEIEMLLHLSDEFGFHIGALQHVLEGYKVAPEIAARNIGASTFSDFWGYKLEAYDGINYNPAAMAQWGIKTSVNSDSGERIRRLNLDAAKSLRYGGLTDDQCLALVTINPAWQLGIDKQTGSLEIGKDADISIWENHPLSVYSRCVATLVDGDVYFERNPDGAAAFGIQKAQGDRGTGGHGEKKTLPAPPAPTLPLSHSPTLVTAKPSAPATFAIVGARILPVSSAPIEDGTIVVQNGRITAVGRDVSVPAGVRTISGRGLTVCPGFINATGNVGLAEIESVPESNDLGEQGPLKAHLRAVDAFHVQSAWVGVARCAGVTTVLTSPRGQGWMGRSALMHTAGRTVEESTVAADVAYPLSLSAFSGRRGGGGDGGLDPAAAAMQQQAGDLRSQVVKALDEARDYGRVWEAFKRSADSAARPPRANMTFDALLPAARGERPVIMSGLTSDNVSEALKFGADNHVNVVITGGRDAEGAADALKKAGTGVIFTDLLTMPTGGDAYDKYYAAPKRLFDAGVRFCIATSETPMLPQIAGMAAAFGLPRDEALKAITLYPAQILGVEADLGSLDPGKLADLLITDGDPLEFRTQIKRVFVNGVEAPLTSKHRELYEQYRKRK